jgi:hypothetical protein
MTQSISFLTISVACDWLGNGGCDRDVDKYGWKARLMASHSGSKVNIGERRTRPDGSSTIDLGSAKSITWLSAVSLRTFHMSSKTVSSLFANLKEVSPGKTFIQREKSSFLCCYCCYHLGWIYGSCSATFLNDFPRMEEDGWWHFICSWIRISWVQLVIVIINHDFVRVPFLDWNGGRLCHWIIPIVNDCRFESNMQMRGKPPLRFKNFEKVHQRRWTESPGIDVVSEEWLFAQQFVESAMLLNRLGPIVWEKNMRRGELVCPRKNLLTKW